jgi:hypothetical protein
MECFQLYTRGSPQDSLPAWRTLVDDFRVLEGSDVGRYGFIHVPDEAEGWDRAYAFGTYVADQTYYLPWLAELLEGSGRVEFVQRRLESLEELASEGFTLTFNCAGANHASP